ncbi:hypothetical protein [Ruminococcus sp.]|uniref:hypothetical protein n=1 Tax=Ruminococcus sp. TaxID=41978 RepID=UPI003AAD05EE
MLSGIFVRQMFRRNTDITYSAHIIFLSLFEIVFLFLLRAFLLLILPVTLLLFLVLKVVTHLSGVLVRRVTLSDKGINLRQQSIVFLFQLGGLRLQIALLRHFPFDVVRLDMLGNILVGFFKRVDSGSILLAEVLFVNAERS